MVQENTQRRTRIITGFYCETVHLTAAVLVKKEKDKEKEIKVTFGHFAEHPATPAMDTAGGGVEGASPTLKSKATIVGRWQLPEQQ